MIGAAAPFALGGYTGCGGGPPGPADAGPLADAPPPVSPGRDAGLADAAPAPDAHPVDPAPDAHPTDAAPPDAAPDSGVG